MRRPALGLCTSRASATLLVALALALALGAAAPAHAADDSNSGKLTPAPTVNPQALSSALSSLAQGTNDTQMQQLLAQFESQLNAGNYSSAHQTLLTMQGLDAGSQSGQSSVALNTLINSLSVGSSGASIDPNTLASILNATSSQGQSAQSMSVDMQTLANLMQYVNPTLASQLLQGSNSLSQAAYGNAGTAGGSVPLPGLSGLSGVSVPSVGAPAVPAGAGGFGVPSVSPYAVALPLAAIFAVAALYLSRRRIAGLLSSEKLSGISLLSRRAAPYEHAAAPSDPRGRIEYYFARAVRAMGRRGVSKTESETHREFSSKVSKRPEEPDVVTIASLYERAKFSGRPVGDPDADVAGSALSHIDEGAA